jgi:hypothetical protein
MRAYQVAGFSEFRHHFGRLGISNAEPSILRRSLRMVDNEHLDRPLCRFEF